MVRTKAKVHVRSYVQDQPPTIRTNGNGFSHLEQRRGMNSHLQPGKVGSGPL